MPLRRMAGLAALLAGSDLLAGAAWAQAPGAAVPDAPIIVTARRIEEPVDETPMSVAVLDAHALDRSGAESVGDIAHAIPNFTVLPTGVLGVETPAIRGIFSPAGSATVGLYLDDVPVQIRALGFSRNVDLRTFDLERVEVMRGPQGTLFGANSMGGTIRFITRQPSLSDSDMRASGEIGFTKGGGISHELQGAAGGPIIPGRLGVRTAIYRRVDAGHVDRIDRRSGALRERNIDDVSVLAVRAGAKMAVGERVELTPVISYQRGRRDDYPFFDSTLGPHRQSNIHRQPARDDFVLPSLTAVVDFDGATLTSVTAYLDRDDRQVTDYSLVFGELVLGGGAPGLVPDGGTRSFSEVSQRGWTQEIRLASSRRDVPLRWVAGLFYRDARIALSQEVVEPGIAPLVEQFFGGTVAQVFGVPLLPGGISYRGVEHLEERQIAGFGEVNWRALPRLELSGGVRVARSELDLRVLSEGPYAGGRLTEPAARRQRETPVNPRIGLSYRLGPNRLLYASAGKGFRIGGANPPVPAAGCAADLQAFGRTEAPISYDSDTLWSYEVGAKAAFPRQRLRASASLFRIDWSGIQQPVMLPNCGFSFVDNLGVARSQGFEAEVELRPVPRLLLQASLGFVDARFRATVLGGAASAGKERAIIVRQGDRVPFVPRWSGRLAAEYRPEASRRLYMRVEYQFASGYRRAPSPAAVGYDPRVYIGDGFDNVLLRVGFETGRWRLSAFAQNLLDDRSVLFNSAEFVPVTGAPLRQMTPRPRTIGLAASATF